MRSGTKGTVPLAPQYPAVDLVVKERRREEMERGFVLRQVDVLPLPAHVAVFDIAAERFRVDVTDRSAIARATEEVAQEWGVPHVLVNAAALDSPPDAPAEEVGPFESYPERSFDQVMDVNVKGTFLSSQVVGSRMAAEGRGSIVDSIILYSK